MIQVHRFLVPTVVADKMASRRVLIVGGDRRREQLARLCEAFPTTTFVWRPTRESDARTDSFERLITGVETDIVIILLLARHAHTKGARRLCSACGKPLLWCRRPTVAAVVRAIEQHCAARLTFNN